MLNFIFGLILGAVVVKVLDFRRRGNEKLSNPEQSEHKAKNLEKVMAMAREKGEIQNDDVQYALGVSDATATRYLEELEKSGKLTQSGEKKGVIYRAI